MMSAGSFIAACMAKTREQLASANLASAARQHEIPVSWATYYRDQEMNRSDRRK